MWTADVIKLKRRTIHLSTETASILWWRFEKVERRYRFFFLIDELHKISHYGKTGEDIDIIIISIIVKTIIIKRLWQACFSRDTDLWSKRLWPRVLRENFSGISSLLHLLQSYVLNEKYMKYMKCTDNNDPLIT